MTAVVVSTLATLGVLLMLVAGLGIVRMPDLPTRMHASSKAGTLGAALILIGVAVDSGDGAVAVRAALIVGFLFLTAPVASHVIARAAYKTGVPLSDETVVDELARDLLVQAALRRGRAVERREVLLAQVEPGCERGFVQREREPCRRVLHVAGLRECRAAILRLVFRGPGVLGASELRSTRSHETKPLGPSLQHEGARVIAHETG